MKKKPLLTRKGCKKLQKELQNNKNRNENKMRTNHQSKSIFNELSMN